MASDRDEKSTTYHIITKESTYIATIEIQKPTNSLTLYLGGIKRQCVIINVSNYTDTNTAYLASIKYDSSCNITDTLEEGKGTKHMIFTALNIIKKHIPSILWVTLIDTSEKKCKADKTHTINIGFVSILLYKKTWYERLFNAKLVDSELDKKYEELKIKLDTIRFKYSFINFIKKYFISEKDRGIIIDIQKKYNFRFENIYNETHGYIILFIQKISEKITDKTDLCVFFSYFIYPFMVESTND
jgi:hypothetical protein